MDSRGESAVSHLTSLGCATVAPFDKVTNIDTYASLRILPRTFTGFICLASGLILCALLPVASVAAEGIPPHETFAIRSDPDFGHYRQILKPLAEKYRPGRPSDFCVVGYQVSAESKIAWIIWKQRSELILWEAGESDVDMSRRKLNLKKDVVGSDAELRGSTYLVTKAWVDGVVKDCASHGTQLHLKK